MDQDVTDYLLQELLPVLEDLEAQNAAILSFLKDRGIASDEALKPYLEQAGRGADVKWRAVRARLEHLLAPPPKAATEVAKKEPEPPKDETSEAGKEIKAVTPGTAEESKSAQAKANPEEKASDEKPGQGQKTEDRSKDSQQAQQQGQEDKVSDSKGEKAEEESRPRESAARKG